MYVNQNKLFTTFISLIIFSVTNFCFAADITVRVVGLFKNRVIILDEDSNRKILSLGDSIGSGLKLVSANSSTAVFKNDQGVTLSMGINNDISTSYSTHQPASSDDKNTKTTTTTPDQPKPSHLETIKLNEHNQYITPVSINGKEVSAIIDTGANFVTLNSSIAQQLGLDYKNSALKLNVSTASDKTDGYKFVLKSIALGSISLSNIDAVIIEGSNPELTLIGMSFLKNLDLQYLGDHLEIKKHVTAAATPTAIPTPAAVPTTAPVTSPPTTTTTGPTTSTPTTSPTTTIPTPSIPPTPTTKVPTANVSGA